MALVRISYALINDVEAGIVNFADKVERDTIDPLCPQAASEEVKGGEFAAYCEDLLWGEHLHLKDKIPSNWRQDCDHIQAHIKDENNKTIIRLSVSPEKGQFKGTPRTDRWGPSVNIKLQQCTLPWVHDFFDKKAVYDTARAAHRVKFGTIKEQVLGFLRSSKSLNDAIKKYPDIKLWIPQAYLDSIERVVERKPREQREKEVVEQTMGSLDHSLLASMGVLKTIQNSV